MLYLLQFIVWLLNLLEFMIIIVAIMSWLIAFNVINIYNSGVRAVYDGLNAVIDPLAAADPPLHPDRRRPGHIAADPDRRDRAHQAGAHPEHRQRLWSDATPLATRDALGNAMLHCSIRHCSVCHLTIN